MKKKRRFFSTGKRKYVFREKNFRKKLAKTKKCDILSVQVQSGEGFPMSPCHP
jgi:hypothetical protein